MNLESCKNICAFLKRIIKRPFRRIINKRLINSGIEPPGNPHEKSWVYLSVRVVIAVVDRRQS